MFVLGNVSGEKECGYRRHSVGLPSGGALRKRRPPSPVSPRVFSLRLLLLTCFNTNDVQRENTVRIWLGVTKRGKNNNVKTVSVDYSVINSNRHAVVVM